MKKAYNKVNRRVTYLENIFNSDTRQRITTHNIKRTNKMMRQKRWKMIKGYEYTLKITSNSKHQHYVKACISLPVA